MEINHFSHEHPLVLSEEKFNTNFPCSICREPIFGVSYCCLVCKYVLHKFCGDLPSELSSHSHNLHPDHPLVLLPSPSAMTSCLDLRPSFCIKCGHKTKGFVYTCTICASTTHDFRCTSDDYYSFHVYCALFPEPSTFELPGVETELTLHVPNHRNNKHPCLICRNVVDGAILFPNDGRPIFCHFQCVMLPRIVKHDRHLHKLSLRLPLDEKDKYFEFICDVCEEYRDPDDCVYYCEPCQVVAHIGCGITGFERPAQGNLGKFPIYTLFESEEVAKKKELEEPDYQDLIKYQFGSKEEAEELDESDIRCVSHEIYCSEEHQLVLVKYTKTIKEICGGCGLYVSGLSYSCKACNLFIHKRCTEFPQEIHHPMHSHHGSLELLAPSSFFCSLCNRIFISSSTPAFYYGCTECDFKLDNCCAFLHNLNPPISGKKMDKIILNHPSHEHALTPVIVWHSLDEDENKNGPSNDLKLPIRKGITPTCQACGFLCDHLTLVCESCNFYLHFFCSLLPLTGKHTRHRHALNLTYSYEEDPNALEFFCDTCEKPRIPNHWVYYCPDPKCEIVSHVECVDPDIFTTFEH